MKRLRNSNVNVVKKIGLVIGMITFCFICVNPVYAMQSNEEEASVVLRIDNENVYRDMSKSYSKGYVPVVKKDKVILVLPLQAEGTVEGDMITGTVDLGVTEGSPFIYKNYEKDFHLSEQKLEGKKTMKAVFYMRFELALSKKRKNGTYPVVITASGKDKSGNPISQSFTVYVTITDGEDVAEVSTENEGEKPESSPVVIISKTAISPENPLAGSDFCATVTIYNTSTSRSVQNMVLKVNCEGEFFSLNEDSDSIYIPKLGAGESREIPLHFSVGRNAPEGTYKIALMMNYDDSNSTPLSQEGSFTVTVKQDLQVELTMPVISKNVCAGDTIPLDFQVMNLGRGMIYNARCSVEGDGLVATKVAFIGNLEAGTEDSASMDLFISTKSGDGGDFKKYGDTTGVVTLMYEDADGREYKETFDISTSIGKPVIKTEKKDNIGAKQKKQWLLFVKITAVIILLGGGVYFVRRKR